MAKKIVCDKCNRFLADTNFFMLKNGERFTICRTCMTSNIENDKLETFEWILERFDIPYLPDVWSKLARDAFEKDPQRYGSGSVIGMYIRTMKLAQYRNYGYGEEDKYYADGNIGIDEALEKSNRRVEDRQDEVEKQFAAGEISEAEYETMRATHYLPVADTYVPTMEDVEKLETIGFDTSDDKEMDILEQMSQDDINYLTMKWGATFKPSQWMRLEELYRSYEAENELNTDREDTIRKVCKTSIKMDEALAVDDFVAYKNLSQVYDQLRKSAKLTEAQKFEKTNRDIDVAGQIVQFVEREGGFIKNFPQLMRDEYPMLMKEYSDDKIDFIIKDLENFTRNFIVEERGLGDMIEEFIKSYQEGGDKVKSVDELIAKGVQFDEEPEEEEVEPLPQDKLDTLNERIQSMIEEDSGNLMGLI